MKVLRMRLDAPLLSFGGTVVDANNVTNEMPSKSMVVGLLGNALGYDHREVDALARLQSRMHMGARRDRGGERLIDFQTVDLSQDFLSSGWTTWGASEGREGGSAGSGTHIRYRHYLADASYTIALALEPSKGPPTIEDLATALDEPVRPLFIGRKACLPSEPLKLDVVECDSLFDALKTAPMARRGRDRESKLLVRLPADAARGLVGSERVVTEERDWANQIHVGRSRVVEAFVDCTEANHG